MCSDTTRFDPASVITLLALSKLDKKASRISIRHYGME